MSSAETERGALAKVSSRASFVLALARRSRGLTLAQHSSMGLQSVGRIDDPADLCRIM